MACATREGGQGQGGKEPAIRRGKHGDHVPDDTVSPHRGVIEAEQGRDIGRNRWGRVVDFPPALPFSGPRHRGEHHVPGPLPIPATEHPQEGRILPGDGTPREGDVERHHPRAAPQQEIPKVGQVSAREGLALAQGPEIALVDLHVDVLRELRPHVDRRERGMAPRRLIEGAGIAAHKTAMRAAKPHPADKGTLGRAILFTLRSDGMVAWVKPARSLVGLMFTIEEGRRPGRRPPYGPIKRWMTSHGIIAGVRGDSKQVRAMQEDIKLRGTRGVHFMAQADTAAQEVLNSGVPKTEQEIRDLWVRA